MIRGPRVRLTVIALAVLLSSLAAASPAPAQFGPVLDLSTLGEVSSNPDVAVDPSGTSTVVWDAQINGSFVVQARRITAAGQLGPTVDLSLANAGEGRPRVVVDGTGRATVAWRRATSPTSALIQARQIAGDGSLGPTLDLSAVVQSVSGPSADLAGASTIVVAWTATESGSPPTIKVQARRISAAGTLGAVLDLFQGGFPPEFTPFVQGVGGDAAGRATVLWGRANDNLTGSVFFETRRIAADDSVGAVAPIFTFMKGPTGGSGVVMTVEPDGLATFVARTESGPGGSSILFARRLAVNGTLGPAHNLSFDASQCGLVILGSAVSVAARTTAVFGCSTTGGGTIPSVKARQLAPDESLGPVLDVSPTGAGAVFNPTMTAVRDVRRVSAFWLINGAAEGRVQARRVLPHGRLGQVVDAAVFAQGGLSRPRAAADPAGLTTPVWSHQLSGGVTTLTRAAQGWVSIFADVPHDHPFWNWIDALAEAGITGGCADAPVSYCPDDPVTRAQLAVFLERGLHGAGFDPPAATGTVFGDVPASDPFAKWIEQLAADGITGGCASAPPLYCPTDFVTRGQIAVLLLRARHGPGFAPPAGTGTVFADVPASHPFVSWIEQLAREGITGGCGGTNYCPDATVTRGEMAVLLVRTFNLPM